MRYPKSFLAAMLSALIALVVALVSWGEGTSPLITVLAFVGVIAGGLASVFSLGESLDTQKQIDYLKVPESVRHTYRNLYQRGEDK